MSDDDVTIETKGLDQLLKAFKNMPKVTAKVGILSDSPRPDGGSNVYIGTIHEFGDSTHPVRSFLRMPLQLKLGKEIENSGMIDENQLKDIVKKGSIVPWLTKVAKLAEGVVFDAFFTGGFGKWPKWKGNYTSKTGEILRDTGSLVDSISSSVTESSE